MRCSGFLTIRATPPVGPRAFRRPKNHFPTRLKPAPHWSMDHPAPHPLRPHPLRPRLLRPRHDGWTIDRQMIFLTRLAVTRSVSKAAAAAGMSRQGAYGFRWSVGAAEFDRAWTRILRSPRAARTPAARTPSAQSPAAQTLSASISRPVPSGRVTKLTPQIAARRPFAPDPGGETREGISLRKSRHNVQTVQSCRDGAALSAAPPAPAPRRAPAGSAIDRPGGTARGHR